KIRPANGAAADLSSALTIFVASSLHFPLSTTHERMWNQHYGLKLLVPQQWV
ncbi:inorganic phosphate transporter, partial [Staphylococcus aureus]